MDFSFGSPSRWIGTYVSPTEISILTPLDHTAGNAFRITAAADDPGSGGSDNLIQWCLVAEQTCLGLQSLATVRKITAATAGMKMA